MGEIKNSEFLFYLFIGRRNRAVSGGASGRCCCSLRPPTARPARSTSDSDTARCAFDHMVKRTLTGWARDALPATRIPRGARVKRWKARGPPAFDHMVKGSLTGRAGETFHRVAQIFRALRSCRSGLGPSPGRLEPGRAGPGRAGPGRAGPGRLDGITCRRNRPHPLDVLPP